MVFDSWNLSIFSKTILTIGSNSGVAVGSPLPEKAISLKSTL